MKNVDEIVQECLLEGRLSENINLRMAELVRNSLMEQVIQPADWYIGYESWKLNIRYAPMVSY